MMAKASRNRNVIVDKIEWPVAKVNRLIELYEAQPLLYNNRLKEYHNINLNNDTLKTIATALDVTSKYISLPTSMPPVNHPYLSKLATKPSKASILLRFRYDASKPSTHRNEIEDYDVLVASFDVSKASTH